MQQGAECFEAVQGRIGRMEAKDPSRLEPTGTARHSE